MAARTPSRSSTPAGAVAVTRVSPWIYRVNVTIARTGARARALRRFARLQAGRRPLSQRTVGKGLRGGVHRRVREARRRRHRARSVHRGHHGLRRVREAHREDGNAGRRRRREHSAGARDDPCAARPADGSRSCSAPMAPRRRTRATSAGCGTSCSIRPDRPVAPRERRSRRCSHARYGTTADHWAALGYDAAMLIGRAVARRRDRIARRFATGSARSDRSRPRMPARPGRSRSMSTAIPVDKNVMVAEVAR